ncbi:protein CutA homolog isoform X2 [Eleginops maclovinus]|uniref:protein CutA homolog isoform X2 n=1 Tax=Eleginops maclovinus TaxID=56733 RepID=UPI0030805222
MQIYDSFNNIQLSRFTTVGVTRLAEPGICQEVMRFGSLAADTLTGGSLRALAVTVFLSVLMLPLLRTVGLRVFSMASETYTPGTHSAAFVTCPNDTVAKTLARYEWQGKIEEDSEVLLMIKTRSSKVPALAEYVRSNHPYEVAEVISLPIEQGNPPYLKWIGGVVPE